MSEDDDQEAINNPIGAGLPSASDDRNSVATHHDGLPFWSLLFLLDCSSLDFT